MGKAFLKKNQTKIYAISNTFHSPSHSGRNSAGMDPEFQEWTWNSGNEPGIEQEYNWSMLFWYFQGPLGIFRVLLFSETT